MAVRAFGNRSCIDFRADSKSVDERAREKPGHGELSATVALADRHCRRHRSSERRAGGLVSRANRNVTVISEARRNEISTERNEKPPERKTNRTKRKISKHCRQRIAKHAPRY